MLHIVLKQDSAVKQIKLEKIRLSGAAPTAGKTSRGKGIDFRLPLESPTYCTTTIVVERWMAQHFSQTKAYRNFSARDLENLGEQEAWEWFVKARWGSLTNVACPSCGTVDQHYAIKQRRQWRCKHCARVFSVTSDTPLSGRRLSFKRILQLAFWMACRPKGVSANQASAELGTTFRTAYQNLQKVREVLFESQDRSPLFGNIQIDGGHFCGKPRRPRKRTKMTSEIANNHLKNRKAALVPNVPKATMNSWNREKLKKRRIILTLRQLGPNPGDGAVRTITCVVKAEKAEEVIPIIQRYVQPGSTVHTDDGNAFCSLSAWYEHATVRHSVEYSTDTGVNNNQAESFFSRSRRSEYGVYHGMRPTYLAFYAAETAWLDDNRRVSVREKLEKLLRAILSADISRAFRGYCQGHRLGFEYLG